MGLTPVLADTHTGLRSVSIAANGEVLRRVPGYSSSSGPGRPAGAISVVGPTARILGLRKDFIVASVCRAARRTGALLAQATEDY